MGVYVQMNPWGRPPLEPCALGIRQPTLEMIHKTAGVVPPRQVFYAFCHLMIKECQGACRRRLAPDMPYQQTIYS